MATRLRAFSAPPRLGFAASRSVDSLSSRAFAALSGLLSGYDFGVTAGILIMESFVYDYCVDWHNYLREDCKAPITNLPGPWTTLMTRYIVVHYVGCFVGAMLSARLADRFGRRRTIFSAAMLYCIACGGAFYMPPHWRRLLLTVRAAQGLAMGVFSNTLSLFVSEIAPFDCRRADLTRTSRIAFAAGMVLANAANMLMERRIQGWRKTNAVGSLIPLAVMFAIYFVPASPKWTFLRKGRDEAEKVLRRLRSANDVQFELDSLALQSESDKQQSHTFSWSPTVYKSILTSLFMHVLQQATGIGAVLTFAALIFKDVARAGLSASMLLSLAYLMGSMSADQLARMFGRRRLLLFGAISMAASHSITAAVYWTSCDDGVDRPDDARCSDAVGWLLSWTTAWFVFSFAVSWGSATSVESFSSSQAAERSALCVSMYPNAVSWIASAAAAQVGMVLLPQAQLNDIFFVLAWLCGYAGLFVYVFCPETSGNTCDDCRRVKVGHEKLSECLEKKSRALFKVV